MSRMNRLISGAASRSCVADSRSAANTRNGLLVSDAGAAAKLVVLHRLGFHRSDYHVAREENGNSAIGF